MKGQKEDFTTTFTEQEDIIQRMIVKAQEPRNKIKEERENFCKTISEQKQRIYDFTSGTERKHWSYPNSRIVRDKILHVAKISIRALSRTEYQEKVVLVRCFSSN